MTIFPDPVSDVIAWEANPFSTKTLRRLMQIVRQRVESQWSPSPISISAEVEVYAMADALVLPDWKPRGMLDTAAVTLRYDSEHSPERRLFRDLNPLEGYDALGDASLQDFGSVKVNTFSASHSTTMTAVGVSGPITCSFARTV